MGLENRDYYRDGYSSSGGGQHGGTTAESPICRQLLIATIVVFLAQLFITRPATQQDIQPALDRIAAQQNRPLTPIEVKQLVRSAPKVSVVEKWLELDTDKVLHGQIWRLITTAFCHDRFGIWHILINMWLLFMFGQAIEAIYGSREFLLFYLTAALVASVSFVGLQLITGERIPAIGASGAVMAVICVYTMMFPRHQILLFFIIPLEMRFLLAIYVIYDVHPVLLKLSGAQVETGVAHAAHLGGTGLWVLVLEIQMAARAFVVARDIIVFRSPIFIRRSNPGAPTWSR